MRCAVELYKNEPSLKYLQVFKDNLKLGDEYIRQVSISSLLTCMPSVDTRKLFELTCVEEESRVVRGLAVNGLLYCDGFLNNPYNMQEYVAFIKKESNKVLSRNLNSDDRSVRMEELNKLRNGQNGFTD